MLKSYVSYCFLLVFAAALMTGCSSYQPTKNVWKSTKGFWNTYVSPPASVDYEEKGKLSPQALALTQGMLGIDVELGRLERTMLNADKPPTREWIASFFSAFPWISGFAGVKHDGAILGQEPANPMKPLDFIPLLYEDKKQSTRALRADVQNSPLGPEVLLAAPLYDGIDFLGVVVAHFDMRTLMQYSQSPEDMVILSPQALLWPGKYDFAATPLAGVNWDEVVRKSASGACTNAHGTFYYLVRYLGNVPLIFAVAQSGAFPDGNGSVEQGLAFFPKEREKLPPPPQPERKQKTDVASGQSLEMPQGQAPGDALAGTASQTPGQASGAARDLQPGSHDSVLLKNKGADRKAKVQERQLEGANVPVERVARPGRPPKQEKIAPPAGLNLPPDAEMPTLSGGRPSPFGPRDDAADSADKPEPSKPAQKPEVSGQGAPAGTAGAGAAPATEQGGQGTSADQPPAALPDGRPSPFGPRN